MSTAFFAPTVNVFLPIYARSESNFRDNRYSKSKRVKEQRGIACMVIRHSVDAVRKFRMANPEEHVTVTLTRIRPSRRIALDDDNLRGSLKAVRDGVADALGIQDNDPHFTWHYLQATGEDYAVRVQISATEKGPT